jgi:hypothetical protein
MAIRSQQDFYRHKRGSSDLWVPSDSEIARIDARWSTDNNVLTGAELLVRACGGWFDLAPV